MYGLWQYDLEELCDKQKYERVSFPFYAYLKLNWWFLTTKIFDKLSNAPLKQHIPVCVKYVWASTEVKTL